MLPETGNNCPKLSKAGLASILRPDFQNAQLRFELSLARLHTVLLLIVPLTIVFIIHESLHALFLWIFTRARPTLVATLKDGAGFCVRLPSWYLPRNSFLIADLAPVCLLTVAGVSLIQIVPGNAIGLLVFCIAVHLACSTGDIVSSAFILLLPSSAYVNTDGEIYFRVTEKPKDSPRWQQCLQALAERILARLE